MTLINGGAGTARNTKKLSGADKCCGGAKGRIRKRNLKSLKLRRKCRDGQHFTAGKKKKKMDDPKSVEKEESSALRLMCRHPIRQPFIP